MILSVLICTLHNRMGLFETLHAELLKQINGNPYVEVLAFLDNKENTTGRKRNELLKQSTGKYIIFIDDDDWIEPYYIEELLKAAESDADCFAINGWITTNGKNRINWYLSKDNPNVTRNGEYLRTTNHITAVKRELALQVGFKDISFKEDADYSERLKPLLRTEYTIEKPLYHYRYQNHSKEY